VRAQLCVLLSLALLLAVAALAEPQLTVMEAGVVRYADVTSSANHLVLVIANNTVRNLVLQSYRVMVNLSGVLLVPAQAGGDGYFVVEGLDPSWQLLLVHMPRDFTTVQASYAFTVATRLPVLSGYIAESLEGGYYCYYSTTTSGGYTMYAAGQQAVTLWSSMHFYVHVAGAQLSNAYAWLGASSSQSSQAAGAQVYHNLYYIRVRDGSSSTQLTAGVSIDPAAARASQRDGRHQRLALQLLPAPLHRHEQCLARVERQLLPVADAVHLHLARQREAVHRQLRHRGAARPARAGAHRHGAAQPPGLRGRRVERACELHPPRRREGLGALRQSQRG